jgi:hypothetical protein
MATVPTRLSWGGLAVALLFNTGCSLTGMFTTADAAQSAAGISQVVVAWSNKVEYAADPTKGGVPGPGLAGRMYLFGPGMDYPMLGDGSLTVDLYDDGPAAPAGGQLIEEWRIDKDTLKRLVKKDIVGTGYTLFLPWGTCKPEVTKVHLAVRYDPANGGSPMYAPGAPLTIEHPQAPAGPVAAR